MQGLFNPNRLNITIILIIILLFQVVIAGCGGERISETTEKYPDGKARTIEHYTIKEGKKVLYKLEEFYDNGERRLEGFFRDGERHGRWTAWHDDGKLWSVAHYRAGQLHGKQTVYYPSGQKFYEGGFEKGIRKGKWRFWNEQGALENETTY